MGLGRQELLEPKLTEWLRGEQGLDLLWHPTSLNKREKEPWGPAGWCKKPRRIETVFSQLVERYRAKKVRVRDRWHLTRRWLGKVLSHTFAVYFCQRADLSPLSFVECSNRLNTWVRKLTDSDERVPLCSPS